VFSSSDGAGEPGRLISAVMGLSSRNVVEWVELALAIAQCYKQTSNLVLILPESWGKSIISDTSLAEIRKDPEPVQEEIAVID
jgi:hypothetical protein